MKQKALKIKNNTLFLYKSIKTVNGKSAKQDTDTTTIITSTINTTGFNK